MEKFNIDFRRINLIELKNAGILTQEIDELFTTGNSEILEFRTFSYAIGYVRQTKFVHVAYDVSKSDKFDIEILQAGIPNEEDIKRYWCNRKRKN